jgi:parvulin-like peptidyl-prolyl isomerase
MADVVRIDDETISADAFIKLLKLSGRFDVLLDEIVKEKLVVHAAKKLGLTISPAEVQERADQLRRARGLHRAADMTRFLENLRVSVDDFERFVVEMMYYEKVMEKAQAGAAIEDYFRANSPRFDSIDVSHMVVDTEGKAKEIIAVLREEPELFEDLAREHSLADSAREGGRIGRVLRGSLNNDVEAKVFHAEAGAVLGPFPSPDGSWFEIFTVKSKRPASFDEDTKAEIRRLIKEEWLAARVREHRVELL